MADEYGSGTFPVARGPATLDVERACNEVDLALAEAAVCLDFLAEVTSGESEWAVSDAQIALQRIGASVDRLRETCARATTRAARASSGGSSKG
jgi:hypothetical protein